MGTEIDQHSTENFYLPRQEENIQSSKEPTISATILNAHTLKSALELIKEIKNGWIEIKFYRDGFIIEEADDDNTKSLKIVIPSEDLLNYEYKSNNLYGNDVPCHFITTNTDSFISSLKPDKKNRATFHVYVNENDNTKSIIIFARERIGEGIDNIEARSYINPTRTFVDYYEKVYKNSKPVSKVSEKDFIDMLFPFKGNRGKQFQKINFILGKFGDVSISATSPGGNNIPTVHRLPSINNYSSDQQYETSYDEKQKPLVSQLGGLSLVVSETYTISVSCETIQLLSKINKLGPYNVIKVYIEIGLPLVIVTKLSNYGNCIFSFRNDLT